MTISVSFPQLKKTPKTANLKGEKFYFSLGGFHSMVGLFITLGL